MVLLYCTIVVPKRSGDRVSGDVSIRRPAVEVLSTCCNYVQLDEALSHEECLPVPNSRSCGLEFYQSVLDASADDMVGGSVVYV